MRIAQSRFEPAGQRLVGQQRIEIDRDLRDTDAVPLGRDGRMQVGQRLGVIEPGAFGHEAFDELEQTIGAIDEAAQDLARIDAALRLAFIEPARSEEHTSELQSLMRISYA